MSKPTNLYLWNDEVRQGATVKKSNGVGISYPVLIERFQIEDAYDIRAVHGAPNTAFLVMAAIWYCWERGFDPDTTVTADLMFYLANQCPLLRKHCVNRFEDGDEPDTVVTVEAFDEWVATMNLHELFIELPPEPTPEPDPSKAAKGATPAEGTPPAKGEGDDPTPPAEGGENGTDGG